MESPKITIKGATKNFDLGGFHFENFRYVEDINLGFPTIEFAVKDNLYTFLREGLHGDEELLIEEFNRDKFKFTQKTFKIKSIGSGGFAPKPATAQTVKIVAIDKNYDSILKNQKSIYFLPTEKKKISDLLRKLLTQVGIVETENFKINIEETAPFLDQGLNNLFIPYSRDVMKVIRKLTNYSMTPDGTGGFIFFINRRGLNFVPVNKLFIGVTENSPYLQITDVGENYGITEVKLTTFNAFTNFITGHEKKIVGFNITEKDYNSIWYKPNAIYTEHSEYTDKPEIISNIQTMPVETGTKALALPFSKDFVAGNVKVYYTPLDNPISLKAFGDKLYYSQMFSYTMEVNVDMIQIMPDLAIGEMVNVNFMTTDADKWSAINGGWLLKSLAYTYPSDNCLLKLTRIGIGSLPDKYIKVGEV